MARRKNDAIVVNREKSESQSAAKPVDPQIVVKPHTVADYKSIYSNFVQAGYTFFDVSFVFGENLGINNNDFIVENKMRVVMSPTEGKIFRKIIDNVIKQYETQFGPINIPESFMPPEN